MVEMEGESSSGTMAQWTTTTSTPTPTPTPTNSDEAKTFAKLVRIMLGILSLNNNKDYGYERGSNKEITVRFQHTEGWWGMIMRLASVHAGGAERNPQRCQTLEPGRHFDQEKEQERERERERDQMVMEVDEASQA
jgi:hypothetical protein